MTKPSRSTSNGREMPLLESAVMLAKPATPVGVIAASEPPVITASQMPSEMRRAALPMACVLAAHAVTVDSHGPRQPNRIDTVAAAALLIIIGTRNGDTRFSPFSWRRTICSSSVWRPPTPVPMSTPERSGSAPISPWPATVSQSTRPVLALPDATGLLR